MIGPIGNQAARRRQTIGSSRPLASVCCAARAMIRSRCNACQCAPETTIRPPFGAARKSRDCRARSRRRRAQSIGTQFHPQRRAPLPGLRRIGRPRRIALGSAQHCHARHAGCNLLEQLQPFPAHAEIESGEPGGVVRPAAPGSRRGRAPTGSTDAREDDRHRCVVARTDTRTVDVLARPAGRPARAHQFGRILAVISVIARGPARVDRARCGRSVQPDFLQPLRQTPRQALRRFRIAGVPRS